MMLALSRLSMLRIARTPRAWLTIGAWFAFATACAVTFRITQDFAATDRFLLDVYAPIAMPLLAMAASSAMTGPEGVRALVRTVQPLGARGTIAAAATILSTALVTALACAVTALIAVVIDRGSGRDVLVTLWVTALGGATYAAYFSLGSTFGPKGSGRGVFLFASWFLANAGTAGSCLSPYAQIRSLLGGPHAGTFSQRASTAVLFFLFAFCALFTAWRCRRRP